MALSYATMGARYLLAVSFLVYGCMTLLGGPYETEGFVFDSVKDEPAFLVWAFFGFSSLYAFFLGAYQVAAAILLFYQRTATLGAVLLLPVVVNMTVISFAFSFAWIKWVNLLQVLLCLWLLWLRRDRLLAILLP